jgi:hypothetical protein
MDGGGPPTVLFIQGSLRSGSTLLESLLATQPGFVPIGETINLYRYLVEDLPCSCGESLRSCPVFSVVLSRAGLLEPYFDLPAFATRFRRHVRIRNRRNLIRKGQLPDDIRDVHRGVLESFADVTKARVVVESSKSPSVPTILAGLTASWPSAYLHLVRDPRAVVFSDGHPPHRGDPRRMPPRRGTAKSAVLWHLTNSQVEWCCENRWRSLPNCRMTYEDLVADVPAFLAALGETLGLPISDPATALSDSTVRTPMHAIGGNPSRPDGPVRVRIDERWRTQMPRRERILAGALTTPLRQRYGYVR